MVSLLKRWLLGTHQGAVSLAHLDYYLDEFAFRFNRPTSRVGASSFLRLVQRAGRHRADHLQVDRETTAAAQTASPQHVGAT